MGFDFDSVEAFLETLNVAVENSVLGGTVEEECKRVVSEEIEEAVYNSFEPKSYLRRYKDGGYGDEENLNIKAQAFGGGISIDIANDTQGNGDTDGNIDEIIETGKGYKWRTKPGARPAMANAEKRIISENIVEKALVRDLRSQGLTVTLE